MTSTRIRAAIFLFLLAIAAVAYEEIVSMSNTNFSGNQADDSANLQNAGHIYTLQFWLPFNQNDLIVVNWKGNKSSLHRNAGLLTEMWVTIGHWTTGGIPPEVVCDTDSSVPGCELQACNIDWELQFCHEGNIVVAVTALLPGYEILNMDYDVSFGGGPWEDLLEGARICPALIPQFATIARAILETPVGYSECTVTVPIPTCSSGGTTWP